ncbi:hypothetical protein MOQ_003364 [Trypanosoma cruzi marinkellei]|uniref:Uncharacterized protein n=1 Tax=Trypanosoma cruzi marinkellei TaxID=85056 RepID=K2N4B5_TRYCR|nr:hypothetical protein MOQ_003364 [Trypanosoma cruzi marinkellei]
MIAGEGSSFTLRLQRLYELIAASLENDAGHDARRVPHPKFLLDVAQEYSNILGAAASLPAMQDSPVVIYEALRVVTLLLAFDSHGSNVMSINTELTTKITNYLLEGIERLNNLFAKTQPFSLPQPLREELLTVVRLLMCPVVQQQLESDQNSLSNSHSSGVINATAEMTRLQHTLIDRRLFCARLLIERGLGCCRDMEELLSSSFVYGNVLQQFLLQTLQEEFTTMRRHASGSLTALNDVTDEFTGEIEEDGDSGGGNSCGENCFCYYALLFVSENGVSTRSRRSPSTTSNFSTGCNTPSYRHTSDDHGRQLRVGNRRSNAARRLVCKKGSAVLCSLAVLASLGTGTACQGETASQEHCDKTSDFVDFVGDLVSVCAVVVRPFLMEQLELMEQMRQEKPLFSPNPQSLRGIQPRINEDLVRYRRYSDVVERFLLCWDSSFIRKPSPPKSPRCAPLPSLGGTEVLEERMKKKEGEVLLQQSAPTAGPEREKKRNPPWEPVAPALAAHLALPISDDDELTSLEVVSLFTEVKQFREAEREALWNQWTRLREKTTTLAADVARMQQRLNSILESKVLLSSLHAVSMDDFEWQWEARIGQRLQELREELRRVQQKQGEQQGQGPQLSRVEK